MLADTAENMEMLADMAHLVLKKVDIYSALYL